MGNVRLILPESSRLTRRDGEVVFELDEEEAEEVQDEIREELEEVNSDGK